MSANPTPTGTRKFLNRRLIRYCKAIIGKQSIKYKALDFKKVKTGIESVGKGIFPNIKAGINTET